MKIKLTITAELDDDLWGFSELLGKGDSDMEDMVREDLVSALDGAKFNFENIDEIIDYPNSPWNRRK